MCYLSARRERNAEYDENKERKRRDHYIFHEVSLDNHRGMRERNSGTLYHTRAAILFWTIAFSK